MCGINGFNLKNLDLLKKMSAITFSRGPDNEGFFVSEDYCTSHNRLAIIDPENRSNQPFVFGRYIITFNGEIYNYKDLKKFLISFGYNFSTTSDTEVIVKLFDKFHINSFKMLSGIFALSIYDKLERKFFLIRDVVGVKPLYYYFDKKSEKFFYSSLIKSLLTVQKNKNLNLDALKSYSNFNRNDFRETFFKDIFKVLPGELIEVSEKSYLRKKFLNFDFKDSNPKNIKSDINNFFDKQFLSDVPVALSLSGGVDSNIIFQELLKVKGKSFTNYSVSFKDYPKYNQDHNAAKLISNKYGVKFESIEISWQNFKDRAEDIVDIVEEPTGNTNSISNLVLSENIREKVIFSGDGGDEVFTGYDRYKSIYLLSLLIKLNFLPKPNKNFKSKMLNRLFLKSSREIYLSFSEQNLFKNQKKIYKNFDYFSEKDLDQTFNHSKDINNNTNLSNVMFHDIDSWVVNDILLRNDKIYANKGIELRVPFLDQNIINKYLMLNGYKKYGLLFKSKNILSKSYTKNLKDTLKKKYGFNSPFAGWLRKDLFNYAQEILSKQYYDSSNHIDFEECQKLLIKHKDHYCDPYLIWNLISLQIFLRKHKF